MEYNNKDTFFLSDDEIRELALYIAYGSGIGVWVGLIFNNIPLYFALAAVSGVVCSLTRSFIKRFKKKDSNV